jgi:hypothetical protein
MEVAVGLEPTKIGFAGPRLDRFGSPPNLCQVRALLESCVVAPSKISL